MAMTVAFAHGLTFAAAMPLAMFPLVCLSMVSALSAVLAFSLVFVLSLTHIQPMAAIFVMNLITFHDNGADRAGRT